jgi:hypothetical protein
LICDAGLHVPFAGKAAGGGPGESVSIPALATSLASNPFAGHGRRLFTATKFAKAVSNVINCVRTNCRFCASRMPLVTFKTIPNAKPMMSNTMAISIKVKPRPDVIRFVDILAGSQLLLYERF